MPPCVSCDAWVEPFMDFGRMPIANGFLTPDQFDREYFFDLQVGHCPACQMTQLTQRLDPGRLFHAEYAYFSSISTRMAEHFRLFAEEVRERFLGQHDPFVLEIGSNDGIMLQHISRAGIRHLGIEPSANVARVAQERGVRTVSRFFTEELVAEVLQDNGRADAILAANVICHIPDLHSLLRGVRGLLNDGGVFVFEEPYLVDIVAQTAYDQIYDEHVFYFSLQSLEPLLARYGLDVVDVSPQLVHGGSMRYFVAPRGSRSVRPRVQEQRRIEEGVGLSTPATYQALRDRIHRSRDELVGLLRNLKRDGKRVVGYGATSKSTTVTNFCGIGPELVEFISDTTPGKQGKYSPGVHIPVLPPERFAARYPDYALLFAWNHADEIRAREQEFTRQGGRFIVYVPRVQILE